MKYALVRRLLMAGIVCILLVVALGQRYEQSAHAAWFQSRADPVKVAVMIDKPAVVRIFTSVVGRLIVHFPTGDVEFPQNAVGYALTLSGSGTFISSHGDILTADHLVTPPSQVFADVAAPDVTAYVNQHKTYGVPLSVEQVDLALASGQIGSGVVYRSKSSEVYLSTDYTGALEAASLQNLPAAIHHIVDSIEIESSFAQKDIAIVHAPFNDTPSVPLANSFQVQPLDELTIVGFPGNGDVSDRPTNLLTSSVNSVTVSSLKTTDTGAPLIQVGGNVEHGDSGGPALDSSGRIVGIVSFGLSEGSPGETSFLQASNSAQALIQQLQLNTMPGVFEKEWSQAYTDYASSTPGHWHTAIQELDKMAAAYPLFLAITPYLANARAHARAEPIPEIAAGPNQTSNPPLPLVVWLSALVCSAGAVVLLVLLLFLLRVIVEALGKKDLSPLWGAHPRATHAVRRSLEQEEGLKAASPSPSAPTENGSTVRWGLPISRFRQARLWTPMAHTGEPSSCSAHLADVRRSWPCGHTNRPGACFCSTCGKPASSLPSVLVDRTMV